jgi:membrane protease YdiL (CAAX protease family)
MPFFQWSTCCTWLLWGLWWACLCLALGAARLSTTPRPLSLAALACAGHAWALLLPPWPVWVVALQVLGLLPDEPAVRSAFAPPATEWLAKVAGIGWSLLLVGGLRWTSPEEAGWRLPVPGSVRAVLPAVLVLASAFFVNAYLARQSARPLWLPEQLFYATLPGLEEELFYRGALLGLLGRIFARTWPLPGTRTSWGGVMGVLLFALGHGLTFPTDLFRWFHSPYWWLYVRAWLVPAHFSIGELLYVLAMGSFLLWVRERTASCWPTVATHCLLNSCVAVASQLPA